MIDRGDFRPSDTGPGREEIGCCAPAFVATAVIFVLIACGIAFFVWLLLQWIGGVR